MGTRERSVGVAEAMEGEVGEQGSAWRRAGDEGCNGGSAGDMRGGDGGCGSAGEGEGALGGSDVACEGVGLARGENERGSGFWRNFEGDAERGFRGARLSDDGRCGGRSEAADGQR